MVVSVFVIVANLSHHCDDYGGGEQRDIQEPAA